MAFMYNMFDDAIGHWEGFFIQWFLNERDEVPIHDILLTLKGMRDVQLLIFRRPPNYPDNFRLIVKHKSVSIQLGK